MTHGRVFKPRFHRWSFPRRRGSSRQPRPQAWTRASNSFYSLSGWSMIIAIIITMRITTILNENGLGALGIHIHHHHQHCNNNLDNYRFASTIIITVNISMMIQMKWDLRRSICRAPNIFKLLPQKMSF